MADEILCSRCSAVNPKGTSFCAKCGTAIQAKASAEVRDELIGAFVGERFLVKRKLGEGGMGVVYEAEQTAIDRRVALKVLHSHLTDEELYARFRNEAAASSRLDHPNTITIYDFGKTDKGALYIAMEYIEGVSLDEEISRSGALDWQRSCHIGSQICGSLRNAHTNGIIHRDMKPENVMLCERSDEKDFVKVLDFGIAKIMDEGGTDQRKALTKTGMVFGTPQYMSPEQIRGEKVDARSDVYSVGVIMYQMLTGKLPFKSDTPMGMLTKHLMDPPPAFATMNPAGSVPPALEALVMRVLEKDPDKRPATMKEFGHALDAMIGVTHSGKTTVAAAVVSAPAHAVEAPGSTGTVPMPAQSMPVASSGGRGSSGGGKAGLVIALVAGLLILVGGGGAAAWYFLMGPGSKGGAQPAPTVAGSSGTVPAAGGFANTSVNQPAPPGPEPLAVVPVVPEGTAPNTGASSSGSRPSGGTTKPPTNPTNPGNPGTPGTPGKIPEDMKLPEDMKIPEKIPEDVKIPEDAKKPDDGKKPDPAADSMACSISGDTIGVSKSIVAALSAKQPALKACVKDGSAAVTVLSFSVKEGEKRLSSVTPKNASNGLQGACLLMVVKKINLSTPGKKDRTGTIRFDMQRTGGVLKKCSGKVATN